MSKHDQLFKLLLHEFFLEFMKLFCPHLAKRIDKTSIEILDKELISGLYGSRRNEVDFLARVRISPGSQTILIHIEAQSQAKDDFAKRMHHYVARLYEKYSLPVYPIALFSFDSPRNRQADSHAVTVMGEALLQVKYRCIQLNLLDWRKYRHSRNPVAAALMSKMNIARQERADVKFECLSMLATLRGLNSTKKAVIARFIESYLQLDEEEEKMYENRLKKASKKKKEVIMDLTTSWERKGRKEGLKEGLHQGRTEGRTEGLLAVVSRQLTRLFGELDTAVAEKLQCLPAEKLEKLAVDLLDFSSISDLDTWLKHKSTTEG